jgi:hypothetical protein
VTVPLTQEIVKAIEDISKKLLIRQATECEGWMQQSLICYYIQLLYMNLNLNHGMDIKYIKKTKFLANNKMLLMCRQALNTTHFSL